LQLFSMVGMAVSTCQPAWSLSFVAPHHLRPGGRAVSPVFAWCFYSSAGMFSASASWANTSAASTPRCGEAAALYHRSVLEGRLGRMQRDEPGNGELCPSRGVARRRSGDFRSDKGRVVRLQAKSGWFAVSGKVGHGDRDRRSCSRMRTPGRAASSNVRRNSVAKHLSTIPFSYTLTPLPFFTSCFYLLPSFHMPSLSAFSSMSLLPLSFS